MRGVHIQGIIQILPPSVVKSYKPLGATSPVMMRILNQARKTKIIDFFCIFSGALKRREQLEHIGQKQF